jgi:hypothetical protein
MSDRRANPARGEAELCIAGELTLIRPTFTALVAAEGEIGPLLALAERAGQGAITLAEVEALIWHCLAPRPPSFERSQLGQALMKIGLRDAMPSVRTVLRQMLAGDG